MHEICLLPVLSIVAVFARCGELSSHMVGVCGIIVIRTVAGDAVTGRVVVARCVAFETIQWHVGTRKWELSLVVIKRGR